VSEKLLSPEEIAGKLAVKPATVRSWLRSGRIKGFKAGQRVWRVREEDYLAFINSANKPRYNKTGNGITEESIQKIAEYETPYNSNEDKLFDDIKKLSVTSKNKLKYILRELKTIDQTPKDDQSIPAYLKVRRILSQFSVSLSDDVIAEREDRL